MDEDGIRTSVAKLVDAFKQHTALETRGAREHGGQEQLGKIQAEMEEHAVALVTNLLVDINKIGHCLHEIAMSCSRW